MYCKKNINAQNSVGSTSLAIELEQKLEIWNKFVSKIYKSQRIY